MQRFFLHGLLSLMLLPLGQTLAADSSPAAGTGMVAGPSAEQIEQQRQMAKERFEAMQAQRDEMRRQENAQALQQEALEAQAKRQGQTP